jgi:hypothetical protein
MTGGWRKLHNEEFHNSLSIIRTIKSRRMGWAGNAYKVLMGKPEGKSPLRRPRHMWVDNFKMDVRGIVWGGMDWIDLAQGRDQWRVLLNTVVHLRVP